MAKMVRIGVTLLVVVVALLAGYWVWNHYLYSPWTRDGRVRAEVITLAPDVSGWVTRLHVANNQAVSAGDPLFAIDDTRAKARIAEAEAYLAEQRSAWELAVHQYERRQGLSGRQTISDESLETYRIQAESARASYELARAQLNSARIDLTRTRMTAPEDGTISNISLREGNYVTRGEAVLSLLKKDSFYVTGYFEETKLQGVHVGQHARITLMGGQHKLTGQVVSIARGIADTNASSNSELLPQVKQVVNWVRLAQRIPVDIALDPLPEGINISAGMTVSIYLDADQ
ncbi:HlyD family secretion protein [Marinobacter sp. X15-166B]|uniref:efflux RND transporter periplasmic adaptor subunit n=1 Tax=Marinobacter sp. X15-166B TaxID=1897620 RepID=UPI00085BC667|nr:HlyD family secretion protein [Marinobacter sp. X15-166B]OEY65899.1 efflux transporter periplasmic adaptor subunit [Marinobacter sp. X15-166B]